MGAPVEGASLTLISESGVSFTTTADSEGSFQFDDLTPDQYRLYASGAGLSTVIREVTILAGQVMEVELTLPQVIQERIMVIGHADNVSDIPGSAYFIDPRELAMLKRGNDDINDVLRQVPGVNVQEEDGYGLRPNIGMRGTGSDRSSKITLMEDGILIAPAPYAAPAAYYFPTTGRMESIEIAKGSSQIRHGPRTTGGVLNLISTSIPQDFRLKTTFGLGAYDARKITATVGDSAQNFGWTVETYQMRTDGFKVLDGGGETGFELGDYLGKFRVNTSSTARIYQELEVKLGKTDQTSNETYLGLTDADFQRTPFRRYAASQQDVFNSEHESYQARHLLALPTFDLTTVIYRNNFRRNWIKLQSISETSLNKILTNPEVFSDELSIARGSDSSPGQLKVRHNNRTYYGAGVQSVLGLPLVTGSFRHQLQVGVRYHQDQEDRFQHEDAFQMLNGLMFLTAAGTPGSQTNRISDAGAWATFVQDTIETGPWSFIPGVRYERINLIRTDYAKSDPSRTRPKAIKQNVVNVFIPGVGVSFTVNPTLGLFGGVHKGFSPPGPGSTDETESEVSVNYELGVRTQSSSLNTEFFGFFNDYKNLLGVDTLAAGGVGEGDLFNGGAARVYGLEASAAWDVSQLFQFRTSLPLRVAYTFTDAEFRNSFYSSFGPWDTVTIGDKLPYIPRHQFFASTGVEKSLVSLRLEAIYVDGMRTEAGQGPIVKSRATDSYLIFNLSGEYSVSEIVSFFSSAQNLTNRYAIVARRPAGVRPASPRIFMLGLNFALGAD